MPAPAVGTPVRVLWGGLGYPIEVPGLVLSTAATYTSDANPDMPAVSGPDLAHVVVFAASGGGLSPSLLTNLTQGTGPDQFTVVQETP
jgi:hypothetical protein